jgi:very-short-patch-repair endonuclease
MGHQNGPDLARIARNGIVTRPELLSRGFSPETIKHAVLSGRLYRLRPGVYAVGTPDVTKVGIWTGAVLSCGAGAALSHADSTAVWGIGTAVPGCIEVSVPRNSHPRGKGIKVHRRHEFEVTTRFRIPVTTPACTIIDMAPRLSRDRIEAMIGEADVLGLVTPAALRAAARARPHRPGAARVIEILDRRTFRLTRSKLERLFIPIAVRVGYPMPLTRQWVNGYEVDFYWPELGLVVETDGLTYHRTAAQQAKDRVRDQTHTASGLTCLRFTHEQVAYEREHVHGILAATLPLLARVPPAQQPAAA